MDLFIPASYLFFFLRFSLSHLSHKDVFTEFTGIQDVKKKKKNGMDQEKNRYKF